MFHTNGIVHCVNFTFSFFLFAFSRFAHVVPRVSASLPFMEDSIRLYERQLLFIPSPPDGHLGCFHLLALVDTAAMNISMCKQLCEHLFSILLVIPRSGIGGS